MSGYPDERFLEEMDERSRKGVPVPYTRLMDTGGYHYVTTVTTAELARLIRLARAGLPTEEKPA
ncbi:MAG: hypothetical protein Q7T61_01020 [Caulobacter sp.]|nr:hypothetical protein [Caulobacter sp.]